MLVEPMSEDSLQDNLEKNPMSAAYYSFSTLVCVPTSKSQEVGLWAPKLARLDSPRFSMKPDSHMFAGRAKIRLTWSEVEPSMTNQILILSAES